MSEPRGVFFRTVATSPEYVSERGGQWCTREAMIVTGIRRYSHVHAREGMQARVAIPAPPVPTSLLSRPTVKRVTGVEV